MIRLLCFTVMLGAALGVTRADQYWLAYEGNDFPENLGWTRTTNAGGAFRYIDQGSLVIDSGASVLIQDYYRKERGGSLDPAPGELFITQWRMRIEEVSGFADPAIEIRSDERWSVAFDFDMSTMYSFFEPGVSVPFQPGIFHAFELRSQDMRQYDLYIDGALARHGQFRPGLAASRVVWGDGVQGASSLTRWDYFRFGVVPEPNSALLFSLAFMIRRDRR